MVTSEQYLALVDTLFENQSSPHGLMGLRTVCVSLAYASPILQWRLNTLLPTQYILNDPFNRWPQASVPPIH